MKKLHLGIGAAAGALLCASTAFAAPTGAGVTISNQATAQYTVDTKSYSVNSPVTTFKVAQIVNVAVSKMDVAPVPVASGDTGKATTFRITNQGNGPDSFVFTAESVAGNNFLPEFASIIVDTNGDGLNNAGDTAYVSGSSFNLTAGQSVTVFVLNNIPANLQTNDLGQTQLKAQSASFKNGPAGTVYTGFGVGGVDVVLGLQDGAATDLGTYKVTGVTVTLGKSSTFDDIYGGHTPTPGATVTYTIVTQVTGIGTATGLKVVDSIPANTTYKNNSIKLNGVALTDALGDDAGEASPSVITVNLGNVPSGAANQTVTFQVTID